MKSITHFRRTFWYFLSINQPLFLRFIHGIVAFLIVIQILSSNAMDFTDTGELVNAPTSRFFTLLHISIGIFLFILSLLLIGYCLKRHGFRYYYPYLWGDIAQIRQDIRDLLQRKLPDTSPYGLASCVQGLGLGTLPLVVLSGTAWFVLWQMGSPLTHRVKDWHQTLSG